MTPDLIDTKAIAALLGLSTKHVQERLVHTADFPRPAISLSRKMRRWSTDDVNAWLEKQRKKCAR